MPRRMRPSRLRLLAGLVIALTCLSPSWRARAMCDVVPGVIQAYRGALGSVNRPFAIPNDDGGEIVVRLRPVCEPDSTGFSNLPGGVAPEDDYFVTVLFEPPGAVARNAVVLGTAANPQHWQGPTCPAGPLPGGGSAPCAAGPAAAGKRSGLAREVLAVLLVRRRRAARRAARDRERVRR